MERAAEPVPPNAAVSSRPLELTPRALVVGAVIGVVLSVGNGYMGLKTAFIDGGSVMAALLGYAFFATFKRFARTPYTALENNITQTVASSAAIMGYAIGLPGAIPALSLMGSEYPGWALAVWGIALGLVGVIVASVLRRKLVVAERLPFPTGAATAEVIETISASRQTAIYRARFLVGSALVAAAFAWFRDGWPAFIPQATMVGATLFGVSLGSLTVGVSWSPLMMSTGMLIGVRNAFSLFLGAVIAWVGIAPLLVKNGVVASASYAACGSWLIWPGVGLLLASSFVPLVLEWRGLVRSFRDIPALLRRRPAPGDVDEPGRFRGARPLLLLSVVALVVMGRVAFDLSPLMTLIGVVLALVLANVCARSAGETDIAPTGAVGTMTQLMFTGNGVSQSLIAGSISAGVAAQTSQTLWAFKAGDRLRASEGAQMWAQILGAVVGALVAVPVYFVMMRVYGVGTEAMPAPAAMSWKATAEAVRGGLSALPPHAPLAGAVAFAVGTILTVLARTRWGRFLPSAASLGIAILQPFSMAIAVAMGGLVLVVIKRIRPRTSDATLMSAAAGGIAGESVIGVIIAALIASGIIQH